MNREEKLIMARVVYEWWDTPKPLREPASKAALARKLGITVPTITAWLKTRTDKHSNFESQSDEAKIKLFDQLLFQLASDPKSPAKYKELFARRYGLLLDKSEQKLNIGFDADEIARIRNKARRDLESSGIPHIGDGEVCPQPVLLPQDIREDKRRGKGNNPVPDVAVPGQSA